MIKGSSANTASIPGQSPNRFKKLTIYGAISVLLLGSAIRLLLLNVEGLWLDEVMQVRTALLPSLGMLWNGVPGDKPPLVYIFLHFLSGISLEESILRLHSLAFGIILIGAVMGIAQCLYPRDPQIPLIAGLLTSFSPLGIRLSRELLPYAQSAGLIALAYLFTCFWFRSRSKRWLCLLFASSTAAMWTSYQSAPPLIALGILGLIGPCLYILETRAKIRFLGPLRAQAPARLIIVAGIVLAAALTTAPLWPRILAILSHEAPWSAPHFFTQALPLLVNSLSAGDGHGVGLISTCVQCGFLAIESIMLLIYFRTQRLAGILLVWLIVGFVFLYLMLRLENHWMAPRYLIVFLPPWAILVSAGIVRCLRIVQSARARLAVGIGFIILIIGININAISHDLSSHLDYRGLARDLTTEAESGDVVLFQHEYDEYCYTYYHDIIYLNSPVSVAYQKTYPEDVSQDAKAQLPRESRIWIAEVVYDAYPTSPGVKDYFLRGKENVTKGHIPYRISNFSEVSEALWPDHR